MSAAPAQSGPSSTSAEPKKRKPRASHPDAPKVQRRKLPPPLPRSTTTSHALTDATGKKPDLSLKTLQGVRTKRTDTTKPGFGREVVFVTRKTGLGALIGRCRSLVMDEGYTRLTLHALSAAIPQALLLLHALMDILPYPKGPRGLWYEMRTGTVECADEITKTASTASKGEKGEAGDDASAPMDVYEEEFAGIGGVEVDEPERVVRQKSSMQIDLYVGPRPKVDGEVKSSVHPRAGVRRNRPSKRKRQVLAARKSGQGKGEVHDDEEAAMNAVSARISSRTGDDESSEVEEVEEPIEG